MNANFFALLVLALLAGCGTPTDNPDTGADADADTDADADGDTDADSDVYATVVVSTEVAANFAIEDDEEVVCTDVTECRMGVPEAGTYPVYATADNYIFGDKYVLVDKTGDIPDGWGDGEWGANFSGLWVEANDSIRPGYEHTVEVTTDGGFVFINISSTDGCQFDSEMTGLEFDYDGGNGYSCSGSGTTNLSEMTVDYTFAGVGPYQIHLVRVD